MKAGGLTGFIVGVLFGIGGTAFAPGIAFRLATPFDEIHDLRARVAEQDREIESQRRDIAAQAQFIRALEPRELTSAVALGPVGRPSPAPAAPGSAPLSLPFAAAGSPPSRRTLESDYADFILARGLTAEQTSTLLDLLARGDAPGIEASLGALFSRPADYEALKTYTRQLPEHRRVRELRASLDRIARPLTPDKAQALVAILARERKSFRLPADPEAALAADPRIGPRLLRDYALASQRTLAAVGSILTPEQLEVLRRLEADNFQRLQLAVKMTPPATSRLDMSLPIVQNYASSPRPCPD